MKLFLADRALQYADVCIRNALKEGFHCHRAILPQTDAVRYNDSSDIKWVRGGSARPRRVVWGLPCGAGVQTRRNIRDLRLLLAFKLLPPWAREVNFADMICFAGRYNIAPDIRVQSLF